MNQPHTPLTDKELESLDTFLADPVREDTTMDVATLEGFLVALAIGPETVLPSQWLPWVWDMHEGEAQAHFETLDEANGIVQLVMRFYNRVVQQFADDPQRFEPIYSRSAVWGAAEWCEGFLLGTQLTQRAWTALMAGHPDWFAPFMRLGTSEGLALIDKDDSAEHWMNAVAPAVVRLHDFWLERRQQTPAGAPPRESVIRSSPKVGRNAPCPCGSGKKYKKCCGAGEPTLH
jgi:uncharacterized protein